MKPDALQVEGLQHRMQHLAVADAVRGRPRRLGVVVACGPRRRGGGSASITKWRSIVKPRPRRDAAGVALRVAHGEVVHRDAALEVEHHLDGGVGVALGDEREGDARHVVASSSSCRARAALGGVLAAWPPRGRARSAPAWRRRPACVAPRDTAHWIDGPSRCFQRSMFVGAHDGARGRDVLGRSLLDFTAGLGGLLDRLFLRGRRLRVGRRGLPLRRGFRDRLGGLLRGGLGDGLRLGLRLGRRLRRLGGLGRLGGSGSGAATSAGSPAAGAGSASAAGADSAGLVSSAARDGSPSSLRSVSTSVPAGAGTTPSGAPPSWAGTSGCTASSSTSSCETTSMARAPRWRHATRKAVFQGDRNCFIGAPGPFLFTRAASLGSIGVLPPSRAVVYAATRLDATDCDNRMKKCVGRVTFREVRSWRRYPDGGAR